MSERIRKEILSLSRPTSARNPKTGRVELVVRGAGNDAVEAGKAIDWMRLVLLSMRTGGRRTSPGCATSSIRRSATYGARCRTPKRTGCAAIASVLAAGQLRCSCATTSFLTADAQCAAAALDAEGRRPAERDAAAAALTEPGAASTRCARRCGHGSPSFEAGTDPLLADAAKDLDITLNDIPDSSLAADWPALCREMASDLSLGPAQTLATLTEVRQLVLRVRMRGSSRSAPRQPANARTGAPGLAGSSRAHRLQRRPIRRLVLVTTRLLERDPAAMRPGLRRLAESEFPERRVSQQRAAGRMGRHQPRQTAGYLAVSLYGGGGGHSVFSKTIGAGLAVQQWPGRASREGRVGYYAERTPGAAADDEVRGGGAAENEARRVAGGLRDRAGLWRDAFGVSVSKRAARRWRPTSPTDWRPTSSGRFHSGVLALRSTPNLANELHRRMGPAVAGAARQWARGTSDVEGGDLLRHRAGKQFAAWRCTRSRSRHGDDSVPSSTRATSGNTPEGISQCAICHEKHGNTKHPRSFSRFRAFVITSRSCTRRAWTLGLATAGCRESAAGRSCQFPTTTTFEFWLFASSSVASMPFHSSSLSEMPCVTIAWKSAMPARLDALALGLLPLLGEDELHLCCASCSACCFAFDRRLERRRQLQIAEQHFLDDDAARRGKASDTRTNISSLHRSRAVE